MAKKKEVIVGNNVEIDFDNLATLSGGELLENCGVYSCLIDTGILALNWVSSGKFIGGGIPGGSCIEVYGESSSGKTLIGTNLLKGAQKVGGVAAFMDAENGISKDFAVKASHVDPKKFLLVKVKHLEGAFNDINKVIRLIREDLKVNISIPIVIVYDSIAASPSKREYAETLLDMETASEKQIKDAGGGAERPGERGKICSAEFRKLIGVVEAQNACVVFINQLRSKIGVLFGCFFGGSKVCLADGTVRKIKTIVKNREPVEVLSYNTKTGKIEPKKVIGWHDNGLLEDGQNFLKIKFKTRTTKGYGYLMPTENHMVFKYDESDNIIETNAGSIKVGDNLAFAQPYYLNNDQMQVVYGSLLGDGCIYSRKDLKNGKCRVRFGQGIKQTDYLKYKRDLMANVAVGDDIRPTYTKNHEKHLGNYFNTFPMLEIGHLGTYRSDELIPQEVADNLNELGLAIWYLDDGSYSGYHEKWGNGKSSICCTKFKNREIMLKAFERLGLTVKLKEVGFTFDGENTIKLHQMICKFVPESMQYKLHPRFHNLFGFNLEPFKEVEYRIMKAPVLSVDILDTLLRRKFDLTIEDNATYLVGDAIVHNSPLTNAGGGKALEYYCENRLQLYSSKQILDNVGNVIGVNIRMKNTKNRCTSPFKEVSGVRLFFDQGIDPFGGLLEALLKCKRITQKTGGNYLINPQYTNGEEVSFKSSKEKNTVPVEVLLKYPSLVDTNNKEDIQYYIDMFNTAIEAANDDTNVEIDFNSEVNV